MMIASRTKAIGALPHLRRCTTRMMLNSSRRGHRVLLHQRQLSLISTIIRNHAGLYNGCSYHVCRRQFSATSSLQEPAATTDHHHASSSTVLSSPASSSSSSSRTMASTAVDLHDHHHHHQNNNSPQRPDFDNYQVAYASKSTFQLLRAMATFGLCQIKPFVKRAEQILTASRKILGDRITDGALKASIFSQFCAGEDEKRIQPTISKLEQAGVGSILDYSAEDDDESTEEITSPGLDMEDAIPKVRIYDYESEAKCDAHLNTFLSAIRSVKNLEKDGFAACKVTALGNPKLLTRMSLAIVEAKNLFSKFDKDGDGLISKDEFDRGLDEFFLDNYDTQQFKKRVEDLMPGDNADNVLPCGSVDYITWSHLLAPRDLPKLTACCKEVGPLALVAPTEEEVQLIEKMYERGHILAQEAAACDVRLLIDAEWVKVQPAIDNVVLDLQRTYNAVTETAHPIIYHTYQCYLKDAMERIQYDVERSERYSYHFGAKLVRGAYMERERETAEEENRPSPIHDTIQDTHNCYNDAVRFLLEHATKSIQTVELMCATHNQESIELALAAMKDFNVDPKAQTISFAQLYGMMDHLSFNLGKHGYRTYKYVPYGEVKQVVPYLIRRANENSSVASGAKQEMKMIASEIKRRMFG